MLTLIEVGEGLVNKEELQDVKAGAQTRWPCGTYLCESCGNYRTEAKLERGFKAWYHS